jgi:hypothetical protein
VAKKFGEPSLTSEQVQNLPLFAKLSGQQGKYVLAILAGAEPPVAYAAAYNVDDPVTAAKACHTPIKSHKVQKILHLAYGVVETRETLLRDLNGAIANSKTTTVQLNALLIRAQILGLLDEDWTPEKQLKKTMRRFRAVVQGDTANV